MKKIQHFLGLGWDVIGAGVVQFWTRFIFPAIDSSNKWSELGLCWAGRADEVGSMLS
jgi:hypothetical protein